MHILSDTQQQLYVQIIERSIHISNIIATLTLIVIWTINSPETPFKMYSEDNNRIYMIEGPKN